MTYTEALRWIHSRLAFGSRPGLDRIEALLDLLDNPQNKIKTIHVAGTNGKGSTVSFLRSLLEGEGLKVGTFTSPYITVFNERIALNNQPISNQELVTLVERFQPLVASLDDQPALAGVTEFEIITAMMFTYFAEAQVDVGIIEVGLGGTLDCTNVITPLIASITTIGLDHMAILGNTLEEIAAQKAGIIKAYRPVVTGNLPEVALKVIREVSAKLKSPLIELGQGYQFKLEEKQGAFGEVFTFTNQQFTLPHLEISLNGQHQIENASLAIELYCQVATHFEYIATEATIRAGIQFVAWPGRMEVLQTAPLVILDGAHNEPAIKVLVNNLQQEYQGKAIKTVFAAIQPKEVGSMLNLLGEVENQELFLTTFDYPKAYQLKEYPLLSHLLVTHLPDWQVGIEQLIKAGTSADLILITGSLYFISQVRTHILGGSNEKTV